MNSGKNMDQYFDYYSVELPVGLKNYMLLTAQNTAITKAMCNNI